MQYWLRKAKPYLVTFVICAVAASVFSVATNVVMKNVCIIHTDSPASVGGLQ